jgi:hypothetical protein
MTGILCLLGGSDENWHGWLWSFEWTGAVRERMYFTVLIRRYICSNAWFKQSDAVQSSFNYPFPHPVRASSRCDALPTSIWMPIESPGNQMLTHRKKHPTTCKLKPLEITTPPTRASFLFSFIDRRTSHKIPHRLARKPSTKASRTSIAIMSLSNKLSITDVDLSGKRVLIRVSYFQTDGHTDDL